VRREIEELIHVDRERSQRERARRWLRRLRREDRDGAGAAAAAAGMAAEVGGSAAAGGELGTAGAETGEEGGGVGGGSGGEEGANGEEDSRAGEVRLEISVGAERADSGDDDSGEEEGMDVAGPSWTAWARRQRRVAMGTSTLAATVEHPRQSQVAERDGIGGLVQRGTAAWQRFAIDGLVEEAWEDRRAVRDMRASRMRRVRDGGQDVQVEPGSELVSRQRSESPLGANDGRVELRAREQRRRIAEADRWRTTAQIAQSANRGPRRVLDVLDTRRGDGHADRRAAIPEAEIVRLRVDEPPATVEAAINPARPAPRVQRQQLDLMEQARLYEMQIWSQRAEGGGLTPRQRDLLASGLLLVQIPDDRMVEAESALHEITGTRAGYYPPTFTSDQVETYRRWGVYSMIQSLNSSSERRAASAAHARIDGLNPRVPARVHFAGVNENGSPRAAADRRSSEDDSLASAEEELTEGSELLRLDLEPYQRDMPEIDVSREPDSNLEAWERHDMTDASPQMVSTAEAPAALISPGDIATAGCPCHAPRKWEVVGNIPTHSKHLFEAALVPPTLAQQRDSAMHRTLPVPFESGEEPSDDTHEILVSFSACGHNLAVFVPRLQYRDASHVTAECGCYGFDRCLVTARKASSLQACLACRMSNERIRWSSMADRNSSERCPWFEWSVRQVDGAREIGMWPFGARARPL
jgi:hypothetical protein